MTAPLRIGNGAGFWGDSLAAPRRLVESARLDYLTLEYLAELTLSILAHQRRRDSEAGYAADFPTVLADLLPLFPAQPQLKIVTNAGGMNPAACARAVAKLLRDAGHAECRVAAVAGDDLAPRLDELTTAGEEFRNLDTGRPWSDVRAKIVTANAYLGAAGIVEALSQGARIVVTGRVADASLTLGPAVHEFGWAWDAWDRLAAASVAGHLIECGAQVTGGMCTDPTSCDLVDIGYPYVELTADGGVCVTKPAGTGGRVDVATVSEQLVYEIGDPAHYLTPDVDVDFTGVTLAPDGPDRVLVHGARGRPRPETLKVSAAYDDGYMASGTLVLAGPDAAENARRCGELILARLERSGFRYARSLIECLGAGDELPGVWPRTTPSEVVLRVTVHDPSRAAVDRFLREFAPLAANGPPGVTGYVGPRPPSRPVLAYWPTLVQRDRVTPTVEVRPASEWSAP